MENVSKWTWLGKIAIIASILSGAYTGYLIIKGVIKMGIDLKLLIPNILIILILIVSIIIIVSEKYKKVKKTYTDNLANINSEIEGLKGRIATFQGSTLNRISSIEARLTSLDKRTEKMEKFDEEVNRVIDERATKEETNRDEAEKKLQRKRAGLE